MLNVHIKQKNIRNMHSTIIKKHKQIEKTNYFTDKIDKIEHLYSYTNCINIVTELINFDRITKAHNVN